MRKYNTELLHSASDLNRFLGCAHAVALDLQKLNDPGSLPSKAKDDEMAKLVQNKGHQHEADYLDGLHESTNVIEISSDGSLEERAEETAKALKSGADYISQAAFFSPPWHGFADFLRKVNEPSKLGEFSYEAIDTKLARSVKPSYVLQLGLYSDMIGKMQGRLPSHLHVALGDGREESFRTVDFQHTLNAASERYLGFIETGAKNTRPEPCSACTLCGWRDLCNAQWKEEDHLSQVAGIGKDQIEKLRYAGIDKVADLAAASETSKIPRLLGAIFSRLQAQAALQVARRNGGDPVVETLSIEQNQGLSRLPSPDPGDLFFDLEGDPLYEGGLDYLWGIHYRDHAKPQFKHEWGHDHDAERKAFEATVDFISDHLDKNPAAHVYHYAPYEATTLRRLSTTHASREQEVDELLRGEKLVDLYGIVRQAVRTSEPDLSLKTMEIFFAEKREETVTKADQSIVEYHAWRETGDQAILEGILAYNKVDCENTEALRNWLLGLRPSSLPWKIKDTTFTSTPEKTQERIDKEREIAELRDTIGNGEIPESEETRDLVSYLIEFHHRAQKPEWWAFFDRCDKLPEELVDDGDCIGMIEPDGDDWQWKEKRSTLARYKFPLQESKLREGKVVKHAPSKRTVGTIIEIDRNQGTVVCKRQLKAGESFPIDGSFMPDQPFRQKVLENAVRRVAEYWANGANNVTRNPEMDRLNTNDGRRYDAALNIITRSPPRLFNWNGGPMRQEWESLIDAATSRALALDRSSLFVQGPPGTGKTYTSAHAIVALLAAGKKVGVSSNSHKAINNLLANVEIVAAESGLNYCGVKKCSRQDPSSRLEGNQIIDVESTRDVMDYAPDLVGGTAFFFAEEALDQYLDYLFVDEAGQVSLGHLIAMGAAAKNIILVGDQMQLGQPIQGAHPGESGLSVLDYLLQGEATVAPARGILLDTSWRMHPEICGFISEAVYDGRLKSHGNCANQILNVEEHPALGITEKGIRFLEMSHEGCGQASVEEAKFAAAIYKELIGKPYIDRNGDAGTISSENVLIVAPYNMQVNLIEQHLPAEARIGTVDKFQGQEAEVVIVSMATSSPEHLPRHVDFFYSKNRLNVAVSRARTLAIVLANPRLLELDAHKVDHLKLVNTMAWLRKVGKVDAKPV